VKNWVRYSGRFSKNNRMKRTLLYILLPLATACTRPDKFVIRGIIEDARQGIMYLDEQDVERVKPADSVKINKKGEFRITGHTEFPRFFNLHAGNSRILPLLVGPGENVSIHSTMKDFPYRYSIEGSEGSEQIKYLNDKLFSSRRKLDSIRNLIDTIPVSEKSRLNGLSDEFNHVVEEQRSFTLEFILDHLTSMASIYAIYQKLNDNTYVLYKNRDIQILKITGAALDTIYPESRHVRSLVADAANLEQQIHAADLKSLINEAESSLPGIALPDPSGDTILLSSLNGKVVLLSFWASWDQNSTDLNYHLSKLYKRYHSDGFEIYQVSLDFQKESWIKAIQYDELPWISVCGLDYPESKVAAIYNVTSLPTTYLISRKGDIAGKNLSVPDLERRISLLIHEQK
jgi:peroxiredoxin